MELTIIGSGTGIPSKTRAYPCTLVTIKGSYLVFDTGPGSLRQLFLAGITYLDIDHLYYTHFHPDHSLDLVSILFAMRYDTPKRTKPLFITGPTGLKAFYEGLLSVFGETIKPKTFDLHFKEIEKGEMSFNDWKIIAEPLQHSMHSIGYRVESMEGKTLTYSGDTGYCDGILRLAKKVNTLVLECSFPDDQRVEGHLTPRLCAQIANESQCGRLVLSHFYPVCDIFRKNNNHLADTLKGIYNGDIIFAEDFARITL
ncbi:MAG: MBL fold metallo-hydrolase [Candidatus Brocadia sp.]|nr:MAG: MBL fold metallo-hydrolase [Candidatus Brocadia sp.]